MLTARLKRGYETQSLISDGFFTHVAMVLGTATVSKDVFTQVEISDLDGHIIGYFSPDKIEWVEEAVTSDQNVGGA